MKKLLILGMLALIGLTSYSQDTCEVVTVMVYEKIETFEAVTKSQGYYLDTQMGVLKVSKKVYDSVEEDMLYKANVCRKEEETVINYIVK